ncbi:MAG TPA: DUF6492 family protein [Thermodesulfovibrionales bacterium]|jgi:hypothetical protein|nr:DUF6492 family protein [Thermodesulfovibrionales bacterium]
MEGITLFCKSYRNDLTRTKELTESVRRFNNDSLPFYISVPENDLGLFRNHIGTGDIEWLRDQDIIGSNRNISHDAYGSLPGRLSQQIVKADFWRVNPLPSYLCIDSDSIFIRAFRRSDFMASGTIPYTLMHEGKSFHEFCLRNGLEKDMEQFEIMKSKFRDIFNRQGPSYNFGPLPATWHRSVWQDLEKNYLIPREMTIVDAITFLPSEAFWYGEALVKYRSIDIVPREPFFKAYLFLEEYEHDRRIGVTHSILSKLYCGIVYQSNWHPKRLELTKNYAYHFKKTFKKFLTGFCL